jgi:hypothetical protein
MGDETTKRAAQEYLATKLSIEGQTQEDKLNRQAAETLAPAVWRRVASTITTKCREWNGVTGENTFTCKETMLGDLRIWCGGSSQHMTVHYDSRKLLIIIKNSARLEHETDVIMRIEGYLSGAGRDTRLIRNDQVVNFEMLILGELRVLAGLSRQ